MKKIYQLILALSVIFGLGKAMAQAPQFYNSFTAATTNNSFPLNSTTSNHVQWVYGPNLFASGGTGVGTPAFAGLITKVYFKIGGANAAAVYSNFTISLGQNIGTQTVWTNATYTTGLTTCFYQSSFTMTGATSGQWFVVTLTNPFPYDPSLSLIFDLQVSAGTGNTVAQTSTGGSQRIWGLYGNTTGANFGTGLVNFGMDLIPASTKPNDAGIASIDSPAGGCEGLHNVVVSVKNFGINQVDTVTVNWMFNGVLQTPVDFYQLLDTFNGVYPTSAQLQLGSVTLTGGQSDTIIAWTTMPNNKQDSVNDNDTAIAIFNSLSSITNFPYIQDYENGQGEWYIDGANPSWAYGNPAKTVINGAASGLNAFVTGGLSTGQYNAGEASWVGSPCFDFTGFQGTPWVALDVWWNSEFSWDGAVLQTSVDGGNSWKTVGAFQDPNNWYNDNTINGNPGGQQSGWTGRNSTNNGSGGWITAKHTLDQNLIGNFVRFRVAFGSDGSVNDDGFAFDNFRLVDFQEANLGPDVISLCGNPNLTLDPGIPVSGNIVWSTMDSSSASIVVTTADTFWVVMTDTLINESTTDTIIVIQTAPPVIQFAKLIDTISVDDYITLDPRLPFNLNYTWTPGNYSWPYLLVRGSDYGVGSHSFHLDVVDSVLCKDAEDITVIILDFTGINEDKQGLLSVYPNPVESLLILDLRNIQTEEVEIALFDLQGKMIYSNVYGITGNRRIELNMSDFHSGPYLLRMNAGQQSKVLQVIKK